MIAMMSSLLTPSCTNGATASSASGFCRSASLYALIAFRLRPAFRSSRPRHKFAAHVRHFTGIASRALIAELVSPSSTLHCASLNLSSASAAFSTAWP